MRLLYDIQHTTKYVPAAYEGVVRVGVSREGFPIIKYSHSHYSHTISLPSQTFPKPIQTELFYFLSNYIAQD